MKMEYEELDEFKKDFKKLSKKYRSLNEDIKVVKKVLSVSPAARPPFSFRIDGLGIKDCVIKVKKIACRSLKGKGVNSGLRLVYAHFESNITKVEEKNEYQTEERIVLVEIYHKNEKEKENKERILKHFK